MLSLWKHPKSQKSTFLNLQFDRKFDRKALEVEIAKKRAKEQEMRAVKKIVVNSAIEIIDVEVPQPAKGTKRKMYFELPKKKAKKAKVEKLEVAVMEPTLWKLLEEATSEEVTPDEEVVHKDTQK